MTRRPTRRAYLAGVGSLLSLGLAGCATDADSKPPDSEGTTSPQPGTGDGTAQPLDLREANVVGVAVEPDGDRYRFDVTLYHDDEGEDGYANWWQVERRSGERLGRRELAHAHGTQEFTRSATVAVPEGVDTVVVRGHDQTHGYGGQAMLVTVATGETEAVRQGSEPDGFGE
jgi:hypothetical protein